MKPIAYMKSPLPEIIEKDWKKGIGPVSSEWLFSYLLDFTKLVHKSYFRRIFGWCRVSVGS